METGNIGKRIRAVRKDTTSLSQEDLARRAEVSLNVVSRLERGTIHDPHISTIARIADALGVPVTALLDESDNPKVKAPYLSDMVPGEERREAVEAMKVLLERYAHAGAAEDRETVMNLIGWFANSVLRDGDLPQDVRVGIEEWAGTLLADSHPVVDHVQEVRREATTS